MSPSCLHPSRQVTQALDGAFLEVELPALLTRVALYLHTGRLAVKQSGAFRDFVFREGRLVYVHSSEAAEAFEHFLVRFVSLEDPRVQSARAKARCEGLSLLTLLEEEEIPDAPSLDAAMRAQARCVIGSTVGGGDAIAWFDRESEPGERSWLDLHLFGAVWDAVLERWTEAQRVALAKHFLAGGLEVNEAAQPFLRQVGASREALQASSGSGQETTVDFGILGALSLCGLVGTGATEFVPEAAERVVEATKTKPDAAVRDAPFSVASRCPERERWGPDERRDRAFTPPLEQAHHRPGDRRDPALRRRPERDHPAGVSRSAAVLAVLVAVGLTIGAMTLLLRPPEQLRRLVWGHDPAVRSVGAEAARVLPRTGEAGQEGEIDALIADANQHLNSERTSKALNLLRRALEMDPERPDVHRALGIAHTLEGEPERAATAYRHYLELRPQAADAAQVRRWLEAYEQQHRRR